MQDKNTTSAYNENIVQEIMELIDEYRKYGATQDLYTVESKLRELVENKFSVQKPLSDDEIEKLRRETFSTDNPFCPCDSKTMRKAVWAAESAHGITK